MGKSSFEITGKTIERELFGTAEIHRIREALKEVPGYEKVEGVPEYMKYRDAMRAIRKLQPGDPKDPKPDFAYETFITIEKLLAIDGDDMLSFYTAVETPFYDRKHGVDGWFELDDGRFVTVDLTANPDKDKHKADIIFLVPGDGLDRTVDEQQFLQFAHDLASRVAQKLAVLTK